ncbi:DUF1801 domain-containing protein, partial [Lacticaseibacillus baoqingensis]
MTVITDYIQAQPPAAQPHLQTLYATLKTALPNAQERISYGIPAFWQQRVLVYFGVHKTHVGFYPTAAPIAAFAAELKAYQTSKGAIQFAYDQPLPLDLITRIAHYRLTHADLHTPAKRRAAVPVPETIAQAMVAAGVTAAYAARPLYQRTDYLNWIALAKQQATQQRRLDQMLAELTAGNVYVNYHRINSVACSSRVIDTVVKRLSGSHLLRLHHRAADFARQLSGLPENFFSKT